MRGLHYPHFKNKLEIVRMCASLTKVEEIVPPCHYLSPMGWALTQSYKVLTTYSLVYKFTSLAQLRPQIQNIPCHMQRRRGSILCTMVILSVICIHSSLPPNMGSCRVSYRITSRCSNNNN